MAQEKKGLKILLGLALASGVHLFLFEICWDPSQLHRVVYQSKHGFEAVESSETGDRKFLFRERSIEKLFLRVKGKGGTLWWI